MNMRTITFNELRKIKDSLPSGSMHRIADELGLNVDTVRNFFGGHNFMRTSKKNPWHIPCRRSGFPDGSDGFWPRQWTSGQRTAIQSRSSWWPWTASRLPGPLPNCCTACPPGSSQNRNFSGRTCPFPFCPPGIHIIFLLNLLKTLINHFS